MIAEKEGRLRVAGSLETGSPEWFEKFLEDENLSYGNMRNAGLDHGRHFKNVAIFQPYHAHGKDLLTMLEACERHGLEVYLTGISAYYPSWTFQIIIYRLQDREESLEYRSQTKELKTAVPTE